MNRAGSIVLGALAISASLLSVVDSQASPAEVRTGESNRAATGEKERAVKPKSRADRKGRRPARRPVSRQTSKTGSSKTGPGSERARTVARGRSSARSRARARARARALARLRVLRAREAALRNASISNIGNDRTNGEDPEIRRVAIDALQGRAGTVVIMNPNNGQVYTIVNQRMGIGTPVKPCSTIKLVVGLAALHEGVFDPNQDVQFSRRGSMNLTDAMARSNNPVFQVLGRLLGFDKVINYASNYGFGQKTGVNYPGESEGFLPEPEEQETGLMSSHGENFGVTAIQLAAFTAAIANGGSLYAPRTPRTEGESLNFEPVLVRQIEMSAEDRLRLLGGMIGTVNYGTGRLAYTPLGQVAGKTGTCTDRDKLGLFTSFSSVDNPQIVVTVITTGYQEAGRRAAEIAGRIYAAISPRFLPSDESVPASSSATLE
ncbi:MAG: hypothetical protein EBZ36_00290 [Acidobacteria bacterium]|nr:hypothetical protein [Acidobacteriota bacterium]